MTDEFYYMIPVDFMTDFSVFDSFFIKDMAQFGYDYSVAHNKTQAKAEQLNLALFGYNAYGYYLLGKKLMAFDSEGEFDERLWNANETWKDSTVYARGADDIKEAKKDYLEEFDDPYGSTVYAHLLENISGEAAGVLEEIKSYKNGVFVPVFSNKAHLTQEVYFHAVKYINGFAANEKVSVFSKGVTGAEQDTFAYTKARFDKQDMSRLPLSL